MWIWDQSSRCPGKDWWLFGSSYYNTQNWFWPQLDTKLKIEAEFKFQALTHNQAVCLNLPESNSADHWEDRLTSCPSTFSLFFAITDQDVKALPLLVIWCVSFWEHRNWIKRLTLITSLAYTLCKTLFQVLGTNINKNGMLGFSYTLQANRKGYEDIDHYNSAT